MQPQGGNRHAVFFTHAREAISTHYERNPDDPRIGHALTLEVDAFGNVLKEAAIGYGRRQPDPTLPLQADRDTQTKTLITCTESGVTNPIDEPALYPDDCRAALPCETRTFELTGYLPTGAAGRFQSGYPHHKIKTGERKLTVRRASPYSILRLPMKSVTSRESILR